MDFSFEIDENEDIEADISENSSNGIIFLIDCQRSIFQRKITNQDNSSEISWFESIIESCISVAKNKALNYGNDTLAVLFLRVTNTTDIIMKNVFVFQSLKNTSVKSIQELIKLKSLTESQFDERYGFSKEVSLFHGLWCCQQLFGKSKVTYGTKQILLFTTDDDPHQGDEDIKRRIFVKGHDLMKADTHIELIPISITEPFNSDKFYKTLLLSNLSNEDTLSINDPVSVITELTTRVRHKQYKKRRLARLNWQLGSERLSIGVSVYNMISKTPNPTWVRLDRSTNTEVISRTTTVLKDTEQNLMSFDMKPYLNITGQWIGFEREELQKIHSVIEPGIRLLGFKPMRYLKAHYQVQSSQFLYPDESTILGSAALFAALLKRCSDRCLFALCVYVPRKSSHIRFVALVPQLEKAMAPGAPSRPSGFHAIFLPFSQDIRRLNLPSPAPVTKEDKDMCKKLIDTLAVDYDPESILNPALQKKLIHIEALALGSETADKFEDHTVVDPEDVNAHCGAFLRDLKRHFRLDSKADIAKSQEGHAANLERMHKAGSLGSLTVVALKAGAAACGIILTVSKKADIVEAIAAHFDKQ